MNRSFRFPRFGRPWASALVAGALSLGAAGAAGCDLPEELLDVQVGQSSRGSAVVRIEHQDARVTELLLPPEVLRPNEQAYVAARVDCDGVTLLRLLPELRVSYQADTQQLRISPALARLGQRDIDVGRALVPADRPVVPSFGVDFGAQAAASYDLRGERAADQPGVALGTVAGYVGVGGGQGNATGYLGAVATRRPGEDTRVQLRATAQYAPSGSFAVYAAYHAAPGVTQPGFSTSDFSGVTATYRRVVPAVAPPTVLQLENPSVITVVVNGQRLGSVEAPAGEVTLRNIPLPRQARNTIQFLIEDENGVTPRTQENVAPSSASLSGGLLASVSAGYSSAGYSSAGSSDAAGSAGWSGAASVSYALTPLVAVQAQGSVSGSGALSAGAQVRYAGSPVSGGLGVQVGRAATTEEGRAAPLDTRLSGTLGYSRGPLSVSGAVQVPVADLPGSTLNLRASYSAAPWEFSLGASSSLAPDTWQIDGGMSRVLSDRSSVSLSASARPGGWSAALRGSYVFTPRLQGTSGVSVAPGVASPSVTLSYRPDPSQSLFLSADLGEVGASYALSRGIDASVSATTRGASAQVTGAVAYLDGRLLLAAGLAQRGVLVRTGVPGLALTVGGLGGTTTNAQGDALITQVTPAQPITIRVNPRDLPLGVSIGSVEAEVLPAATGVTVLDWRDNFRVSTFVRFRWAPAEVAAGADLYLDGEKILLDDEGYGLVPRAQAARSGELRDPAGTRRCVLMLAPGAEDVTCASLPPTP